MDKVTWADYGTGSGGKPLRPARAVPAAPTGRARLGGPTSRKPTGGKRPLGIATLEDKVLQRAVVEVLNAIYEVDFLGFSFGSGQGAARIMRSMRSATGIFRKKVNWILEADIRDFFTRLDHGWLREFLERRIADERVLRLIYKWVNAGVIEDGRWTGERGGAPARGHRPLRCSPTSTYQYVLDQWAKQWRGPARPR